MATVLNLDSLADNFLCLTHPTVINTIPRTFIKGCSIEVNLNALSLIEKPENPKGETKYSSNPITAWV